MCDVWCSRLVFFFNLDSLSQRETKNTPSEWLLTFLMIFQNWSQVAGICIQYLARTHNHSQGVKYDEIFFPNTFDEIWGSPAETVVFALHYYLTLERYVQLPIRNGYHLGYMMSFSHLRVIYQIQTDKDSVAVEIFRNVFLCHIISNWNYIQSHIILQKEKWNIAEEEKWRKIHLNKRIQETFLK